MIPPRGAASSGGVTPPASSGGPRTAVDRPQIASYKRDVRPLGRLRFSKERQAMTGLQWVMILALVGLIVVWVIIRKRQAS